MPNWIWPFVNTTIVATFNNSTQKWIQTSCCHLLHVQLLLSPQTHLKILKQGEVVSPKNSRVDDSACSVQLALALVNQSGPARSLGSQNKLANQD